MTLKIIHHKESIQKVATEHLSLNIEKNLKTMFMICIKIVNLSHTILEQMDIDTICETNRKQHENDEKDNSCDAPIFAVWQKLSLQNENLENLMSLFALLVGKKLSLLDAVAKATAIMQKISNLAKEFNISLAEEEQTDPNTEVLTDDDIDIMVQIVKDFGEHQIREDARECREKAKIQQEANDQQTPKEIDVYDVYHDT